MRRVGPGSPEPLGVTLVRRRRQRRRLLRARDGDRALPVRRGRRRPSSERIALPERTGDVFHGFVAGIARRRSLRAARARPVRSAQRASLQAGEAARRSLRRGRSTAPSRSIRRCSASSRTARPATTPTARRSCPRASSRPRRRRRRRRRPRVPWADTIIYELHVRGFTQLASGRARSRCAAPAPASPIRRRSRI